MKILHIISGDLWAGAEVMACHLLNGLHRSTEVDLSVILLNESRLADELRSAGLNIHIADESQHSFFQLNKEICTVLKSNPPQIIHSHRYKENLLAWLTSRQIKYCKLVTTQHGLPESHHEKLSIAGRIKSAINFYALKHRFDKVVAVSDDIGRHFLDNLRFQSDKVAVVHNGIEIPQLEGIKKANDDFVVGSSGRLFPVKDYSLMINIAVMLKENDNIQFELTGDGPERSRLEDLVNNACVTDRFQFTGHLDVMEPFYRGLNIYLNTSIHEGIPMTILEAMSYGLPVVAPKVGGIPEVVEDGVEGFLIDSRDPKAFAEKCLLLAKDRGLRQLMSVAARKKAVGAFSVKRMVEEYLWVYREMLR